MLFYCPVNVLLLLFSLVMQPAWKNHIFPKADSDSRLLVESESDGLQAHRFVVGHSECLCATIIAVGFQRVCDNSNGYFLFIRFSYAEGAHGPSPE